MALWTGVGFPERPTPASSSTWFFNDRPKYGARIDPDLKLLGPEFRPNGLAPQYKEPVETETQKQARLERERKAEEEERIRSAAIEAEQKLREALSAKYDKIYNDELNRLRGGTHNRSYVDDLEDYKDYRRDNSYVMPLTRKYLAVAKYIAAGLDHADKEDALYNQELLKLTGKPHNRSLLLDTVWYLRVTPHKAPDKKTLADFMVQALKQEAKKAARSKRREAVFKTFETAGDILRFCFHPWILLVSAFAVGGVFVVRDYMDKKKQPRPPISQGAGVSPAPRPAAPSSNTARVAAPTQNIPLQDQFKTTATKDTAPRYVVEGLCYTVTARQGAPMRTTPGKDTSNIRQTLTFGTKFRVSRDLNNGWHETFRGGETVYVHSNDTKRYAGPVADCLKL
jgi:hypothetical protein